MTKIEMHIFKVKLPFYPPSEVKCGLQNEVLAVFTIFNLHIIYLIFSYILQTHSSQTIHTYFPYIFLIYLTNTISHKTYIFFTISIHPKKNQTLFQEHVTKPFSWKAYNYNAQSPSYERYKLIILKALLIEGNITHI